MHDVGLEVAQGRDHARERPGQPEVLVARQWDGRRAYDRDAGPLRRAGAGRDDQPLVTVALELLTHTEHGVGDAVDLRKEGLGDHCDAHAIRVR